MYSAGDKSSVSGFRTELTWGMFLLFLFIRLGVSLLYLGFELSLHGVSFPCFYIRPGINLLYLGFELSLHGVSFPLNLYSAGGKSSVSGF